MSDQVCEATVGSAEFVKRVREVFAETQRRNLALEAEVGRLAMLLGDPDAVDDIYEMLGDESATAEDLVAVVMMRRAVPA